MALASGSPYALLVEATRKADWIDVTFFALRFGLPRTYVREVATAFPLDGFYPTPAWPMVADHAAVDEVVPFELALDAAGRRLAASRLRRAISAPRSVQANAPRGSYDGGSPSPHGSIAS
jgi:hypothetical protein